MTSINAIKFNSHSGAMVCDEQRHWNEARMKLYGADKIIPIVDNTIIQKTGLAAAYGNTGTSSIGDEIRLTLRNEISSRYKKSKVQSEAGKKDFMSMEDVAKMTFDILKTIKHRHIDDELAMRYGFSAQEFTQGFYQKNGKKYHIRQKDIVKKVQSMIAPPAGFSAESAVYGNLGIIAGFDQNSGFHIYSFSMREQFMEEIPVGFLAQGSGSDTINFVLPSFFDRHSAEVKNGRLDPTDGIIALIDAVDLAMRKNMGVGGSINILLFNSHASNGKMLIQINDHRAKLALETINALRNNVITYETAVNIVGGMLFQSKDVQWAEDHLWQHHKLENDVIFHRFLRGYQINS